MTDNIAYPGNPGLPKEVREKILSTFRHSLNLFKAGKAEDCAVGCEFILKMDPRFVPAKRLLEQSRNPDSRMDLAELESYVAETLTPMEKLGTTAPDKLLISAIEAYAERDFDRAIEESNRVLTVLPGNNDAREILEKAKRKKELQPHVENFRQRALFALESGQADEAKRNFERMRSLDPEHPEVEKLSQKLQGFPTATEPPPDVFSASTFEFPFGDFGAAAVDGEPFGLSAASSPPQSVSTPPESPPSPPAGFDSLSLETSLSDWPVVPDAPEAPPSTAETPPPPSASGFGDFWNSSSPEISLAEPAPPDAPSPPTVVAASPEIQSLLDEGDRLSDKGDHQGAIETWSRIFLSDLSNSQAASRIENARARLAETNRRVSEALRQGRMLYESGKPKEAREKFLEVLAIDENEATARAYLHRIEDDLSRPPAAYDLSATAPSGDVLTDDEEAGGAAPADESRRGAVPRPAPKRGTPMLPVAAAALLAAIAIGLFLMLRPHGGPPPIPASSRSAAVGNPIGEATRLFQEGNVEEARQTLLNIPPSSPQYARARKMLATFGPAAAPPATESTGSTTAATVPPPPLSAAAHRQDAEKALSEHRYIAALTAFHLSASGYAGDTELKKEMAQAAEKVQEISPAVKLFNDGDYDSALPILWRLYQADHQNSDVRSYLVRCYYNQGVTALQNNLFDKAAKAFGDALGVEPDDELSVRQKAFAERYMKRPADLLARVYLKYLRPRP
jgi:tetratricopeptide (TPR) repeat protein